MLFIDASKEFRIDLAKNFLEAEHIEKIFNAYKNRTDVEKYAHLATFEEIGKNAFNLNIPRYVDTSEEEAPIDLEATFKELAAIEREEKEVDAKLSAFFKELGISFEEEKA